MTLERFTKNMAIISGLDDEPNDVGGLSASDLKAKFDEGGIAVKEFINDTLIPNIEEKLSDCPHKEDLDNVVLGQIPDGSITKEKLNPSVLDGVYDKKSVLSGETKALYGLGTDAVPDNVLSLLSRFQSGLGNEYLWKRVLITEEQKQSVTELVDDAIASWSSTGNTFYYGSSFKYSEDGSQFVLQQTGTLTIGVNDFYNTERYEVLKGKYIIAGGFSGETMTYCPSTATFTAYTAGSIAYMKIDESTRYTDPYIEITETDTEYVNSPDPNAYPPAVDDGFTYVPFGQLGGFTKTTTGSYKGTGTYGQNNPNSLTFDFEPKALFISADSTGTGAAGVIFAIKGQKQALGCGYPLVFSSIEFNQNTVRWYSDNAGQQANNDINTYYYVAIG